LGLRDWGIADWILGLPIGDWICGLPNADWIAGCGIDDWIAECRLDWGLPNGLANRDCELD
jgi:hypothetical protein